MERLLEDAALDEEQEKKLEREFSREYHLITREDRLEAVAEDIVEHFTTRGFQGKAMVICIDKATAVRMYNKVQKYWQEKLAELRLKIKGSSDPQRTELQGRIRLMETTDMAVVVSQSQNEIHDMEQKGLDIRTHRKRMIDEDLEKKFKNPDDPFRLVFVCAMWMTGFDVPSCSTLYLDKPMRNHTLMQTIARANRVYQDKVSGLIVDYVGVFRNIEKALAIYGPGNGSGDENPVKDKEALVEALKQALEETWTLCRDKGIVYKRIEDAESMARVELLNDAVDALVASDEHKKRFMEQAAYVNRLFKAVLPDQAAQEVQSQCDLVRVLANMIRSLVPPVDISKVMEQIEELLDHSIAPESYLIDKQTSYEGEEHLVDLSNINFDALRKKFEKGRKHTEAEKLKGAIARKLNSMVQLNRQRADYLEKFQKMIDEYNSGSVNVEEFFRQLTEFALGLSEEEQRSVSENLTEEELALFDLLTKPEPDLTKKERDQVKKTARELLETLKKEKLVLDWRKRQEYRAQVKVTIETLLDSGLPEIYDPALYEKKTTAVYQHIYDNYFGAGKSVYSEVA
ncbi:MAG: DUF3387 domain-containing protein, partial [Dethiobacteria bacterium]|nr:DUF3387 domain-containing protein [Dethiobacteria bacterium]